VIYGLSLVPLVSLVRELSNTMILIFLIFRVGDLLLKLSIWIFLNARADHRKLTVPTVEECNSSAMGFALGLIWDNNDPFTHWQQPSSTSSSFHVASGVYGGPESESTAEEHGSEPDSAVQQMPIFPADNASMDLLASVATGIIEVRPNLGSAADVLDEFKKKQHRQN
jgi:hypothetical protein